MKILLVSLIFLVKARHTEKESNINISMKKCFIIIYYLPLVLTSCSFSTSAIVTSETENSPIQIEHSYDEIFNKRIDWEDIFNPAKTDYFVYFYSRTCSHCQQLKNKIIDYGLNHEDIYFCEASEKVKIVTDNTGIIGASSVQQVCLLGYPSLIEIIAHIVDSYFVGNKPISLKLNL